jgi:hypothetical protein
MGTSLHSISFSSFSNVVTNSLVKSTWKFLYDYQIELHHNIHIPPQRQGDQILMEQFCKEGLSIAEMSSLNRCRLALKAYHLSDIADGSGRTITNDAWLGQ